MTLPIDPSMVTGGGEWAVQGIGDGANGAGAAAESGSGSGFGGMLVEQLGKLEASQNAAADASQALATGQAANPEAVVMAVERARLSMQLASTLRSKATEAFNDVFHTQV